MRFLWNAATVTINRPMPARLRTLSLVLALFVIPSSAPLAACEVSPNGDIQLIAEPGPVAVATDYSLEQIGKLAGDAGSDSKGAPLGFYVATFLVRTSVSLESDLETKCTRRIRIEITMPLTDRRIEIGREIQQLCGRAALRKEGEGG
jgi:hypothetical protein